MKHHGIAFLAALVLVPVMCLSQTARVLKNSEVNEAALVDALLPEAMPVSRSIRVTPDNAAAKPSSKQLSASMLVTFETNSAELTPRSKQLLDTLARALQSDKLAEFGFSIEGHADPRGGEQFNLQLSQLRAEKVVTYLSENQGIERSRLQAVGKGQSELLNTSNPDAPENRRVTVKTLVR